MNIKKLLQASPEQWARIIPILKKEGIFVPGNFSMRTFLNKSLNFDRMIEDFNERKKAFLLRKLLLNFGYIVNVTDTGIEFISVEEMKDEKLDAFVDVTCASMEVTEE